VWILWRQAAAFDLERTGLVQSVGVGLALIVTALIVPRVFGRTIREAVKQRRGDASRGVRSDESVLRPYATLFLASFAVLFIEILLIRYVSSQIRIFAFFKNIPLIASFLGLGLGLWRGNGSSRQVLSFLLWLVPLAGLLGGGVSIIDSSLSKLTLVASSELVLGDIGIREVGTLARAVGQVFIGVFCALMLVSIMLLFAHLGRVLADAFKGIPRLTGYTINILGSLVGILSFTALSFLQTPPWVWFAVGLVPLLWWIRGRREAVTAVSLAVIATLLTVPSVGETRWSPYQKLVGHETSIFGPDGTTAEGYLVQVSDVFYQLAIDLRPEAIERYGFVPYPHYEAAFDGLSKLDRVLIVGTGTGNDVAAALRAGAGHVDAVEIDPAILQMGREHHPEDPYGDPRVNVIVEDARRAFRLVEPASYDAVVFGLLDSHTQLGMSSVRLDNFVFTLESFSSAASLLKTGGSFIVTSAVFKPWFGERLRALVEAACGGVVTEQAFHVWVNYRCVVPPGGSRTAPAIEMALASPFTVPETSPAAIPTDDWPFLYLENRGIPFAYLFVVSLLAIVSAVVLRRGGLPLARATPYHAHMFFLGAAFLLMEVYAINRLALIFGTTWIVSAVAIATVLSLIVLANLTVMVVGRIPYWVAYSALGAAAVVSFLMEPHAVLGEATAIRYGYGLLSLSPVYFAGLVFARSFEVSSVAGAALGANILGSAVGGWLEYSTMALGIRGMVPLAATLYLASLVALWRHRSNSSGDSDEAHAAEHRGHVIRD
jgi:spermidine synthase